MMLVTVYIQMGVGKMKQSDYTFMEWCKYKKHLSYKHIIMMSNEESNSLEIEYMYWKMNLKALENIKVGEPWQNKEKN